MRKKSFAKFLTATAFAGTALAVFWFFVLAPQILQLPEDFTYEADVQSADNFYNETTSQFEGEKPSKTKFWYAADGYKDGALQVWNYFDVRKNNGEKIFKVQRLYSIDPLTGRHVKGPDGSTRTGYLFAPRNLKKQDFEYWHINYDAPARMIFRGEEKLFGLGVYRYDCYYTADQTASLRHLPGVPTERGVKTDVYLTLWVEPVSGRMVKYVDKSLAYFYDAKTGIRLNPWDRFSNTFSDLSVAYHIELAKYEKYKVLFIERFVPAVLFFVVILLFGIAYSIKDTSAAEKDGPVAVRTKEQQGRIGVKALYTPLIVLLFTTVISVFAWHHFTLNTQVQIRNKFELETSRFETAVVNRLEIYINVLRSGRGLFAASEFVSRKEWEEFISSLNLDENYPGLQGFGFARYLSGEEKDPFIDEVRKDGFEDFNITPEGARDIYVPVAYIEPFMGRNLHAFGFDMFSENVRRNAIENARDSGRIQLSGKVTLKQEENEEFKQSGALIYAPIYKNGIQFASQEERRKAILGFVYSPVRINDLMAGILGNNDSESDFIIFDGIESEMSEATEIYDSSGQGQYIFKNLQKQKSRLIKTKTIKIANHPWTFFFYSRPGFGVGPLESRFPFFVLFGGLIFGVLLAALFYSLNISRFRAISIAQEMTRDLRQRTEENEGIRMQLELTLADVQAEQAISRVLSERIELATKSAKMGVWEWDISKNTLIWDEQMYKIYVVKKEVPIVSVEQWEKMVHPKDRAQIEKEHTLALKAERDLDTEFRVVWPDGAVHYLKARSSVQRDSAGNPLRMIGVNWDTTERRQAEQLSRDQKYALDQSSSVAITDVQGNIIYTNDKFCEISKYSREELIGKNHRIIKSDEHSDEFFRQMWRTITQGQVWKGEVKNRAKDGSFYWVDVTIIPFLNDENKPYQYMAIRFDITSRKTAEFQLQESQRELMEATEVKSKFVSIVSHELRTPMAAIKEGISLVIDGSLGKLSEKQEQFLGLTKRNVERLSRLINNVLDFQKMQSNTLGMDFSAQDLNEIIREVHSTMSSFPAGKSLAFELSLQQGLPQVILDRDKIIQVLTNLVNNAVRNTDQGSITIVSSLKDGQAHVQVRDTGIGIKPENFDRLFKSFQQLGDESRRTGGTGLGLVICKEIIARHKGQIWVESQWGKGSNFQFTLPLL
ncbi:MAG: CHASE domain-containing protein [Candidatus Omnitrophica bacterium]|nr:CHASE domain-containing protein [Candidatus Omnitrophota bacterium]